MSDFSMIINGEKVAGESTFAVLNPATEQVIAQCPKASISQLDAAVEAARNAFPSWSMVAEDERARLVRCIAKAIEDNAEELGQLLTQEQGKPLDGYNGSGSSFEVGGTVAWTQATAELRLPVDVIQDNEEARVEVHRRPLGVVGSITPWNYPLLIAIWHTMPAILSGNTVVIKPSEYTPLTTLRTAELINDILPPGVFNIVTGDGELGAAMSTHPGINKIVFTGSTPTGKRIMSSAAGNLKRLTLELGGNDAGIVMPDVDIKEMAPRIFAAAFHNNGQTCTALKRLYVHDDVYEELGQALAQLAAEQTTGNGLEGADFGPVQNKAQFEIVRRLAEDARNQGGRFLCGGDPADAPGYFYPLTIVADLPEDAALIQEEQFGPIVPMIRFSDVEEVLARANATKVGLGGSIWSSDTNRATQLAARLECGTAWVNNHAAIQPDAPFGGAKESGLGVEFGLYGLEEYTNIQTLNIAKG